ncbi:FAD-dependent monooxygenase [Nocardia noduli]|uniref:FAD-dependent monooxygenase n=1 Tax=Nocardia noduli TaxID=2815722 RepID=UPI0020B2F6AB|nr:FAD-dependent monooxygenase [Nocardia noduli]
MTTDSPVLQFADVDGTAHEIRADFLVGADGSRSLCRHQVPADRRSQYFREHPFAWFGILAETPPSAPDLTYNHSPRGFALISQRTDTLQRMYFQCDPSENVGDWPHDRIREELQARVCANGHELVEGTIYREIRAAVPQLRAAAVAPRQAGAGR